MRHGFNVSLSGKHTKDYSLDYLQRGDRILPLLEVVHPTHSQIQTTLCRIWSELRFFWACLWAFYSQHPWLSFFQQLSFASSKMYLVQHKTSLINKITPNQTALKRKWFYLKSIRSLTLFGLGKAFADFGEGMGMFGVSTKKD